MREAVQRALFSVHAFYFCFWVPYFEFEAGKFTLATTLFRDLIEENELEEFLTIKAYTHLK